MPPALPDIFSPTASPGNLDQTDLHLRWTDRQLDLRSPAFNVQTPLGRIKAIQLSRSITRRRRWLRHSTTHLLQVELRLDDLRLRLTAEAPRHDTLDGLPFLDAEGTTIPFEHLRDLVNTLLAAELRVTDWDTDQTRLPPDEADRRAHARHRADEARRKAIAANTKKSKPAANKKIKESDTDGNAKEPLSTARRIAAIPGAALGLLLLVNLFAYLMIECTGGSVVAVRAFKQHGEPRLLVATDVRNDETTTLRLSVLDPTTGATLLEQDADDAWVLFREGFSVLQITNQGLWLCGEDSGVRVRSLETLEVLDELARRLDASPQLRDVGLGDPEWIGCDTNRTRFDGHDAFLKGNDGRWYRFQLGRDTMDSSSEEPTVQPLAHASDGLLHDAPFDGHYLRGTGDTPLPLTLPLIVHGEKRIECTFLRAAFVRNVSDGTLLLTSNHHVLVHHLPTLDSQTPDLTLLHPRTGQIAWTRTLDDAPDNLNFIGALQSGTLLLLFYSYSDRQDAEILALDLATGDLAWHREL